MTNALEFVQNATSIQSVVDEINVITQRKPENLAAAYSINALTNNECESLFLNIEKHLNDLIFHQAKFNKNEALEICKKIVDMPST